MSVSGSPGPQPSAFRSTNVDIESTADTGGGYNVGWIDTGEWLEYSPLLTIFLGGCGLVYMAREIADKGPAIILDLNHFVFSFLIAGLLLHWRPRSFTKAIAASACRMRSVVT